MPREEPSSTSAKILYRPFGLVGGVVSGVIAAQIFHLVWKRAAHGTDDPPKPLQSEYPLREIVVAAVIQGAIYATVKALVDRGGARAFQRVTGDWPGN